MKKQIHLLKFYLLAVWIIEDIYENLLRDYKSRQAEIFDLLKDTFLVDEQFYISVGTVLNLVLQVKEIFTSPNITSDKKNDPYLEPLNHYGTQLRLLENGMRVKTCCFIYLF